VLRTANVATKVQGHENTASLKTGQVPHTMDPANCS